MQHSHIAYPPAEGERRAIGWYYPLRNKIRSLHQLNPTIGSRLGWSVAGDGLFRWVNNAGQTMVESIWWTDGLVGQAPPHFDDEVGEGWLVVASQVAWDTITSQLGTLKRMVHVERSFYDKGERLQSDMHAERMLDR
jgi:hypothetical protein